MSEFEGKVVLVTGGTSGIGKAAVLAYANKGAKVAFTGRRKALGNEIVEDVKRSGGTALFIESDVSNPEDVKNSIDQTVKAFGQLDIAFNNAGYEGDMVPLTDQSIENYDKVFDINVRGIYLSMKYQIAEMLKNGGGAIVNNSSIAGIIGFPGMSLYSASKAAVIGMTRSAAIEYAKAGVRINGVAPAAIETEMLKRAMGDDPAMLEGMTAAHPIGRIGKPEEVADAALWLSSKKASFVVGHTLPVDGGFTAQ